MKPSQLFTLCVVFVAGGLGATGCSGIVTGGAPDGGSSSSSSSSSSGGSTGGSSSGGGTRSPCADLAVPDLAKVCPDGTAVGGTYVYENGICVLEFLCPATSCAQGAACQPGQACASASAGTTACATSCTCDATGVFQCQSDCADASIPPPPPPPPIQDASPPTGCNQGAVCSPGSGCGSGSTNGGCSTSCSCDATGHLQCTTTCPPAQDAGCVENELCVLGDHWDPKLCQCVPDQCISSQGGPCGGFTASPCQCGAGLTCVPNAIPDIPGTCEPLGCCPAGGDLYTCTEADGGSGMNCHDPAKGCASSSTCGGGCDPQVTGPCPSSSICNTAADCTGPLPAICELCSDGGSACARWSCVSGACQIVLCD